MNILKTLLGWATSAWHGITGIPGDVSRALQSVWHYITSVHNMLSWITANPLLGYVRTALAYMTGIHFDLIAIHDALGRIAHWIWIDIVRPVRDQLNRRISALAAWTARQLTAERKARILGDRNERFWRIKADDAERAARIKGIKAEAAARVKGDKATLATVQREAATGYDAHLRDRLGVVGRVLDLLATHNPEIKGLVGHLVGAVIDLETIDDPIARWVVAKVLAEVIDKAGVDKVTADLATRLLAPLTGQGRPHDLHGVTADISGRLNALEEQWAAFMAHGGPEVEQAGDEWAAVTNPLVDIGLLGFFGLAVADPTAWAAGIADTLGVVANDALIGTIDLIRKA
jgi:hypothetical protein